MGDMDIEYVVRVKLPSSSGYAASPSGDYEYEQAYNDAIFAVKPPGFEVVWGSKSTWPTDKDGFTWVRLYCTDQSKALEYYINRTMSLDRLVDKLRKLGKQISGDS